MREWDRVKNEVALVLEEWVNDELREWMCVYEQWENERIVARVSVEFQDVKLWEKTC